MNEWLLNTLDSFYEGGACEASAFDVWIETILGAAIGVLVGMVLSLVYLLIVFLFIVLPLRSLGLFVSIVDLVGISSLIFVILGAVWGGSVAYRKQVETGN